MPAEIVLSFLKDLPWKTILKITILFSLFFSVSLTYFNMSALTSVWTSLLVSFIFSTGMTVGIHLSLRIRIAAANSIVQCFSQFGLFMLFTFTSWITIQDTLENFVQVQDDLHSQAFGTSHVNETSEMSSDFGRLESTIVILHYSNAAPVPLIILYSILYELTFEVRKEKKAANESTEGGSKLLINVLILGRHLMSFFVGIIFSFTLALFIFKRFFFHSVLSAISSETCRDTVENRQTAVAFTFYLVFCAIFVVLLPFSRLIPKLRASIIKKFIPAEGSVIIQQVIPPRPIVDQQQVAPPRPMVDQQRPSLSQSIIATFQQRSARAESNVRINQQEPVTLPALADPQPTAENIQRPQSRAEPIRAPDTTIDLDFD